MVWCLKSMGPEVLLQLQTTEMREHIMPQGWMSPRLTKLSEMWAGIVDHLIGPRILPAKLTGPWYLRFLRRHLPQLLEDASLPTRQRVCLHKAVFWNTSVWL